VCCSVLLSVAVCCSLLQCVAVAAEEAAEAAAHFLLGVESFSSLLQCAAVCCSVLQSVAACCSGHAGSRRSCSFSIGS